MDCLGCIVSFKQGEKLKILEGLFVEFKNYNLPIKEQKSMKTLLKTIVSFLNSKGGTIYIGVEDSKGEVKGLQMFQNDKKQFQNFINKLLENITPKISQNNESLVKLQFVPVLSKNSFQNKYVIKIVINQGNPSFYYCYVQRVLLDSEDQQIQHQILYGYFRHNMGGVQQCKGLNLLKQIRNKALNPSAISQTFHANCNPNPLVIQSQYCGLKIKSLQAKEYVQVQTFFEDQLIKQKIAFSSIYKEEKQSLLIKFENEKQFQSLKKSLTQNLDIMNLTFPRYQFIIIEEYERNLILKKKNKYETSKQDSNKKKQSPKKTYKKQEFSNSKPKQPKIQTPRLFVRQEKMQRPSKQSLQNFPKKHSVTLTHLALQQVDNLIQAINQGFRTNQKKIVRYINSIQVFLRNPELQFQFYTFVLSNNKAFKQFGYNQKNFFFGLNLGRIVISNFNHTKKDKMAYNIRNIINEPCQIEEQIESAKKNETKSVICLTFKNKGRACFWLDQLLKDKAFKQKYSIPGSEIGQKAKMKIILDLQRKDIY